MQVGDGDGTQTVGILTCLIMLANIGMPRRYALKPFEIQGNTSKEAESLRVICLTILAGMESALLGGFL